MALENLEKCALCGESAADAGKWVHCSNMDCTQYAGSPANWNANQKKIKKWKENSRFLDCLRSVGVDNWDGYDDAVDKMDWDEDDGA